MQHVTEMPKPPIQYDPSGMVKQVYPDLTERLVARQNPQAPPMPQIHIEETDQLNAQQMHNQMTAYQHREQRRVRVYCRFVY